MFNQYVGLITDSWFVSCEVFERLNTSNISCVMGSVDTPLNIARDQCSRRILLPSHSGECYIGYTIHFLGHVDCRNWYRWNAVLSNSEHYLPHDDKDLHCLCCKPSTGRLLRRSMTSHCVYTLRSHSINGPPIMTATEWWQITRLTWSNFVVKRQITHLGRHSTLLITLLCRLAG